VVVTVSQLRPSVVTGEIGAARAAVESAGAVPVGSLETWEVTDGFRQLAMLESQVHALKLQLLAEADRRRVAEADASVDTADWAAKLCGSMRQIMAGGLRLARLLEAKYEATRRAFAAGRIDVDQVRVIVNAAERMPTQVTAAQCLQAEADLVDQAVAGKNAEALRHAARRMLEKISAELADQHEKDQLEDEERRAENETWFTLCDNGDGTFSGKFVIPELHGRWLRTALERLTAPRRCSRNKAGEPVTESTGVHLNRWERDGLALCELIEHLPTTGHGVVGATLNIHLDYAHLLDGLASARLDTGARVSAGEARRLACNAGLVPMVFNGASLPLDVGREQRLHTSAQRRGLSAMHEHCAAEGCTRPFAWCEIHHPHSWSRGGPTSIENASPLCWFHHRRAHDDRYTIRYLDTGEVRYRRRR
jgi:hypothetical protein